MLERSGVSLQTRCKLFYGVCIPVRLGVAAGVGVAVDVWPVISLSVVLGK